MRYLKRWQLAVVCLIALLLPPVIPIRRGQAQAVTYTVIDLGTLGGAQSKAFGIDNCGRVVGESPTASSSGNPHPFFWSEGGGIIDIGTFGGTRGTAFGINTSATVTGNAMTASGAVHVFMWTAASGMTDIGTLPGGSSAVANDINDSNQLVGTSDTGTAGTLANLGFIWQPSTGTMQPIGPFPGGSSCFANGINNAGQVVGAAQISTGKSHAFVLTNGTMLDLGTLENSGTSIAHKINDEGQVVGHSDLFFTGAGGPKRAFIWSPTMVMTNMNPPGHAGNSSAHDINNSGQAVGAWDVSPGVTHAFIYTQASGMSDLNDSLAPGSNWTLLEARSINDRGQIVGFGINPDGNTHAFLLTPDNVAPSPCDLPGSIQFSDAAYSVNEDESGATKTITVTRTNGLAGGVSVDYATSDGAATAGQDYTSTSGTLTFAEGEISKTFDVSVTDDVSFEGDETVNLTLSNPQGGATIGTPNPAVLTITNDDDAPTLSINDLTLAEGNAGTVSFIFTVTKTGATELPVSVQFATADGTATIADSDYVLSSGTLNFAANEPTKQITVTVNSDSKFESNETFTVNLSNQSNATISDNQSTGTITNDDTPGTLQFSAPTYNVGEAGGTATITVTRTGGSDGSVSVNFATSNGTATSGQDYTSSSGTLTFANGDIEETFTVAITDDALDESDETVNLALSNPTNGASVGTQGTATLTINDNDEGPAIQFSSATYNVGEGGATATITVTRTGGSNAVSVGYATSDGTATTAGLDYTATSGTLSFAAGDNEESFTVSITNDTLNETNETINLTLSNPTGGAALGTQKTAVLTITDNDATPSLSIGDLLSVTEGNGGTTNAVFVVNLSAASGQTVTVNFSTADGTATTADDDYISANNQPVTFNPGDTQKIITVQVKGDAKFENNETFVVNLSSATNAGVSDSQGQGTITNDDSLPSFSINDVPLDEGSAGTTSFTFTVTKTGATAFTSSVNFATADGTATIAGGDYQSNSGTLNFAASDTSKTVTVLVVGDTIDETNETFFVNLPSATGASISDSQGQGTITDDDAPPSLFIHDATVTEGDSGTTDAVFNVTLSAASGKTVTVGFQTFNGPPSGGGATAGSDYNAANGTLTFIPGDTSKSIIVQVLGDTVNEPDELFFVDLTPATNATLANLFGRGTITNDDTPRLQFSQAVYTADESLHLKVINVTRTGDASLPVTVDYVTSDGTLASQRNDYTFAFGTLRFGAGETSKSFELLLTDDAFQEGDETINLTLSNPTGGAGLGVQSTATASIAANDNPPPPGSNPINASELFVRMHYHDFFGRSPDQPGLGFWMNNIEGCGQSLPCREVKRIDTSAAFYLSIEFQETGFLVERVYKTAFGDAMETSTFGGAHTLPVPIVRLNEFQPDTLRIGQGVVIGAPGADALLEANKNAFALEFVQRQRFTNAFPSTLTADAFVTLLNQNAGGILSAAERTALAGVFGGGAVSSNDAAKRAQVLRSVAENSTLKANEKNRAFVLMQYFGYLRRNPNDPQDADYSGFDFWLQKLNQFNGDFARADMVKAFITSTEYRQRFGQP